MGNPYLSPSLARPISLARPLPRASRSRRWPPPPPARPRTCAPAWLPPRAGKARDKLPEASPIHSQRRLSPSSRISSSFLLPPLEPSKARAARAPSHRIPSQSTPLAPPRRSGPPCRSRSHPEPCNAHDTVVFKLRPPASFDRSLGYSPSPSSLSPASPPPSACEHFPSFSPLSPAL